MNRRIRGKTRDYDVLCSLEEWGVMDTQQIAMMHFNDIESGLRKCQERLYKLHEKGKVFRWRGDDGYCYSLESRSKMWQHTLMLNWVRAYFELLKKPWEKIHCFEYEKDHTILRADAFVAIKNTVTGSFKFYFIELDRTHTNSFDKVRKYNNLFTEINKGKHQEAWWVKLSEKFPQVLVITTTKKRENKILRILREDNSNDLDFKVNLLSEIRESVRKHVCTLPKKNITVKICPPQDLAEF